MGQYGWLMGRVTPGRTVARDDLILLPGYISEPCTAGFTMFGFLVEF